MRKVLITTLLATVTLSLAGCTFGTISESSTSTPAVVENSTTPEPTVSIDADLLCHTQVAADANVEGTTVIQHPAWGSTTIIVCGPMLDATDSPVSTAGVLAVDATGSVKWSWLYGDNYTFRLAEPATDASGNIFVVYNPGRYDGVMIMRPTNDSIDVLATTYNGYQVEPTPLYFYDTNLYGPGSDGLYEIVQSNGDCVQSVTDCETFFVWDGTTYVQR